MKVLFSLVVCLLFWSCNTVKPVNTSCFKGRLEIKGACMNYTIKLLEGNMDTSLIVNTWTNESTGKSYSNVFALGSRCSFPADIQEGQEFYFVVDNTTVQNCAVCMNVLSCAPKTIICKGASGPMQIGK